MLPGDVAFKLYDTYGFPLDLTADVCRERGVTVDEAGFDAAMEKQKAAGARRRQVQDGPRASNTPARATRFTGYEQLEEQAQGAWRCTSKARRCRS